MARTSSDPFVHIREATLRHRAKHGCGAYPYSNGPLLSTIAANIGVAIRNTRALRGANDDIVAGDLGDADTRHSGSDERRGGRGKGGFVAPSGVHLTEQSER